MNQTITFNETTYQFIYRLGMDSKNDAYGVYDIHINGEKSIYHLEEIFVHQRGKAIDTEWCLFWDGLGSGTYIKNPDSIIDLANVINRILSHTNK